MKALPAQIRHSLLASAMSLPERIAAAVALRPAAPTIAESTMSTGSAAASSIASMPAAAAMPEPKRSSRSVIRLASSATTARRAPKLSRRLGELGGIRARGDRVHLEAVRRRRRSRRRRWCRPSRSRRAASPAASRCALRRSERRLPAAQECTPPRPSDREQPGKRGRAEEAVDPIEHAAVAGNDRAGILHAEPPLDRRFEEVAGLRGDRKRHREKKAGAKVARLGQSHRQPACGDRRDKAGQARPTRSSSARRAARVSGRRARARRNRRRCRSPRPRPG